MSQLVRVAVVGDSPLHRQMMSRAVEGIDGAVMCASAATLSLARQKLALCEADLVVLDVSVGGEEGSALLPWLREHQPRAVTALLTDGQRAVSRVDALLWGAIALLPKPSGPAAAEELAALMRKLIAGLRGPAAQEPAAAAPRARADFAAPREVVAVGASTGGPPVVAAFLRGLPASFEVPVVITQHMPKEHVPAFVASLAQQCGRTVQLARHLAPLAAASVVVAGDGRHMRLGRRQGQLVVLQDDGPEENYCRPAVDPLFASVAATCGAAAIGVVMTGMGSDGAKGAARMAECGAPLVVQDRQSSAVWGMPGAVVGARLPCQVVPGPALCQAVLLLTHSYRRRDG